MINMTATLINRTANGGLICRLKLINNKFRSTPVNSIDPPVLLRLPARRSATEPDVTATLRTATPRRLSPRLLRLITQTGCAPADSTKTFL